MLKSNILLFVVTGGSEMLRASIPFSTKYPELIIPDESVCLPRITCQKPAFKAGGRNSNLQPYTDFIAGTGDQEGLSGPVDLPPGVGDDFEIQDDDGGGGG